MSEKDSAVASKEWRHCRASDGRCQCGLVWDTALDYPIIHLDADLNPETRSRVVALLQAVPAMLFALRIADSCLANIVETGCITPDDPWNTPPVYDALPVVRDALRQATTPYNPGPSKVEPIPF